MISVPYGKHALYYSNSKRSMPLENDLFFITLISCFLSSSSKDSEGYTQDFHAHFYYEFHYIF